MINLEAANLLAQVLPVGLLIVAVERRALGTTPFPRQGKWRQTYWSMKLFALGITALLTVLAVIQCVFAIAMREPLDGFYAVLVTVAGCALSLVVVTTTVTLSMRSFAGDVRSRK